ncbi:KRAB-A domain-containing protein 2-like [Epargyreus clarus]|uniref:KRAB-A domain-containing protein 2-like n=1 Tax=Epargyreus clarus TaxID=520877 RepID=UPI003C2C5FA9
MKECNETNKVDLTATDSSSLHFKDIFYRKLVEYDNQHQGARRKPWTLKRIIETIKNIKQAREMRTMPMDYYWMGKYDYMTIENEECLIFKRNTTTAPIVRILPREQYFDMLLDIHKFLGHAGRDRILLNIKNKYYIPKKAIELFLSLCPVCEVKRNTPRKDIETKVNGSRDFNMKGHVSIIDFQSCPDGDYKWLLSYQDSTTKFVNPRPLQTKEPSEVASELIKIFLTFGAPSILQYKNESDFFVKVIKELVDLWPQCKTVFAHQTRVRKNNKTIENMVHDWMKENKSTNWSLGCYFVQYSKNASHHQMIGRTPYKALFGCDSKGLNGSDIPVSIPTLETEEQLKEGTDNNDNKRIVENIEKLESNFNCEACNNDTNGEHKFYDKTNEEKCSDNRYQIKHTNITSDEDKLPAENILKRAYPKSTTERIQASKWKKRCLGRNSYLRHGGLDAPSTSNSETFQEVTTTIPELSLKPGKHNVSETRIINVEKTPTQIIHDPIPLVEPKEMLEFFIIQK